MTAKNVQDVRKAAGKPLAKSASSRKKKKQPTQTTPMQRVMVLKDGRRKVMEWRPWTTESRPW